MPSQQIEPFEAIAIWKWPSLFYIIPSFQKGQTNQQVLISPSRFKVPPNSRLIVKSNEMSAIEIQIWTGIYYPSFQKCQKKRRKIEKIPLKVKVWWWNLWRKYSFFFDDLTRIFHTSCVLVQSLSQIRAPQQNFCCGFCADILTKGRAVTSTWFMAAQQQQQHWQKGKKRK